MHPLRSLWARLTFSFLFVAVVGIGAVALLANQATATGVEQFFTADENERWIVLADELAASYAARGNWSGADALLRDTRPGQRGVSLLLLSDKGIVLGSAGSRADAHEDGSGAVEPIFLAPVVVNNNAVGTLQVYAAAAGGVRAGEQFLDYVGRALWLGGGLAVLTALALSGWLAARLSRPVQTLTNATRRLAAGASDVRVPVDTADEIGELAGAFNQMADALQQADVQRRQLLADVAHELRTPLTIMRGHVSAMLDGVFPLDAENLTLVHEETLLLSRLVEDLRTLSLAESGELPLHLALVDPGELARQAVAAFLPLAEVDGIRLQAEIAPSLPGIEADADRLQQVLGNLLSNALRHVVSGSAEIPIVTVQAAERGQTLLFTVSDNGPGLSASDRENVFSRFWRGDRSRARTQGGSGLGLAIAEAIIHNHGGRIWVEGNEGGGSTFLFALPFSRSPAAGATSFT